MLPENLALHALPFTEGWKNMVYNHFRWQMIIRVSMLTLTVFICAYLFFTQFYITSIFFLILITVQMILIIKVTEKGNYEVAKFFDAIKHADFTLAFPKGSTNPSFDELYESLNTLLQNFKTIRAKEEQQRQFLLNILHHVNIAILAIEDDGTIILINTAGKKLFNVNQSKHINDLPALFQPVFEMISDMANKEQQLIKLKEKEEPLQLSVIVSRFVIGNKRIQLISLQNIGKELNEQELEAWHKLIKVLTHEIMNSMTPITSLASSAKDLLQESEQLDEDQMEDLRLAIQAINKRSEGLMNFVQTYRSLIKKPEPHFQLIKLSDLFLQVKILMQPKLKENKIHLEIKIDPPELKVTVDPNLIEQVLINLVINAIDALKEAEDPVVHLIGYINNESKAVIKVRDNGAGILEEVQQNIFIPFFSTKRQGSGIGLSLSRNIIKAHGGSISVDSELGKGTDFTIVL